MVNKKIVFIFVGIFLIFILGVGCKKQENTSNYGVTISGSTSVGPLVEAEAEKFKESNPEIGVQVNQLGSSAGIKDAINGTVNIGMSSRDLKDEEKSTGIKEVEIAYDGIAIIVHPSNPIKSLTVSQIKDIYTGKITNWKDVGGKDSTIVVVSREDGSGTRDAFQEILGYKSGELYKESIIGDGSGNIKTTVATNEHAIGFISFEYIDESVKGVEVDNIKPEAKNVIDSTYKISRPFLLVYREDKMDENSKKFIDYILSEEGQKVVQESGLIKIK